MRTKFMAATVRAFTIADRDDPATTNQYPAIGQRFRGIFADSSQIMAANKKIAFMAEYFYNGGTSPRHGKP
jgi:hypothetical protein